MDGFEIDKAVLDALVSCVGRYGVSVDEDWNEPEGARFIGTFKGHRVTLFPKYDSHFAMYFTVAHLYGHMVQLTRKTPAMERSIELVYVPGRQLTAAEVQGVYDYEVEAAVIGRRLMDEAGAVSRALDEQYSRMFLADFHYLVNWIETREGGLVPFERYLRREPVPWRLLEADPRPLVDLAAHPVNDLDITVV